MAAGCAWASWWAWMPRQVPPRAAGSIWRRARRTCSARAASAAPCRSAHAVWTLLRRRSLAAGLPAPVHPHMLRHSFASHVLQSSGDLRAVQELLGHANIATTQVYTRLDFQHLAKAYDAAHPRAHRKPK